MANNKTGFDYYRTDTDRYQDRRIKRLKKDFGCAGLSVYYYLLREIYRMNGCFNEWDANVAFDVAEYIDGFRDQGETGLAELTYDTRNGHYCSPPALRNHPADNTLWIVLPGNTAATQDTLKT